jgi:lipopolysaccharide transport system permease protein
MYKTVLIDRNASRLELKQRVIYLRDLLRELVVRDMKLRYKRSVLGIVWSLLNPLAQLLVLNLIFSWVLPLDINNYPLFLFIGLVVWTWFQTALFSATSVIVDNPDLIRRPGFPVMILPVVTVTTHLIHFLIALPLLLLFLPFGGVQLTGVWGFLPLVLALQFVLTLSLSYLVATLHVTFRDTQYLLGIALLLGFYVSPIFYETSLIPAHLQWLYRLNPMVSIIEAYRIILIQGMLPDLRPLLTIGLVSAIFLWVGYVVFIKQSYRFVEEI